jgi:phosphate transport system permease protein
MTAVDSPAAGDSAVQGEVTSVPPRTTLPPRPVRRATEPRPLTMIRAADVLAIAGALCAALATTGLMWQELSPFSGVLGYVIVTWCLFVLCYTVLVSFDEDRPTVRDRVSAVVVQSLGALVVAALVFVILYTFVKGWPALHHLNFFTKDSKVVQALTPLTEGGILHAVVGTLIELAIALVIAVPLGILAAVFMNEVPGPYARFVRTVVDAMTAMPDVLAGLFIYATLILSFRQGFSGGAAGIALGITALPIVCRAADVVLRLVPGGLTEASYALGSGQWRTVWHVTLPTARSGLATAVILGAARAVGETAPVLICAGETNYLNFDPKSGPMMSLPLMVFSDYSSGFPLMIARAFGAAAVLLVVVLALFVIARQIGGRGAGQLTPAQQRRRSAASRRDLARFARHATAGQPGWVAQPGAAIADAGAAGIRTAQEWR